MKVNSIIKRGFNPILVKWLESAIITIAVLVLGTAFNSPDPFFVTARFPWLWFATLLVALRYGMGPGVFSFTSITILMLAMMKTGLLQYSFPTDYMLGGLLLTMICGQFSTVWHQKLRKADKLSEYATERAENLSRAYFMLRLSHDRLEQNLISKPVTLRQAMVELRELLARNGGEFDQEVAGGLMAILSHYCSLNSAAIYQIEEGKVRGNAIASCGKGAVCDPADVLLSSAIETGNTAFQSVNMLQSDQKSSYLVACPMRSSSGKLMAVLLVTEMPFLALQRENLQILGVLLSYCIDHVFATATASDLLSIYPECPDFFAAELLRMHRLNSELGINSILIMLHIKPIPRAGDIAEVIEKQKRGLDHIWVRQTAHGTFLITLMPFSGIAGGDGYVARVTELLRRRFGITPTDDVMTSRMIQVISSVSAAENLKELFKGIDE